MHISGRNEGYRHSLTSFEEWENNPFMNGNCLQVYFFSYISGRNEGYRHSLTSFEEWEKNHGYDLSSDSSDDSEYENEALKDKNDKGELSISISIYIT